MGQENREELQSGYLGQDFRLFHIRDQVEKEFDPHYHDFNKIVVFISGKVKYTIEGKTYHLKPWDLLLVNRYDVHKPEIDASLPYERIIIWIKNDYLRDYSSRDCDISSCFQEASESSFHMVRLDSRLQQQMRKVLEALEDSLSSEEFGSSLLSGALFLQFMVYLNRIFLRKEYVRDQQAIQYDEKIEELLQYINTHLKEDLSVEALSRQCYLSKYHLMRKFKKATGFTLHNYIVQKRLLYANERIERGEGIMESALESGFADYTTFSRAYKKLFGHAPSRRN